MAEKNLEALFLHSLKDIYFAEQQIAKLMPTMIKAAESDELRSAFETHARETDEQVRRLEQVFEMLGETPQGVQCDGILGIIKEGQEIIQEFAGGEAFEAGLIAAAQSIEHYEIARYGTLKALGEPARPHGGGGVARTIARRGNRHRRNPHRDRRGRRQFGSDLATADPVKPWTRGS